LRGKNEKYASEIGRACAFMDSSDRATEVEPTEQRVKPLCCQISRKFMHPNGLDKQGVGIVFGLKLLHWNKKVFIRLSASEP
jgi:hypothetical protein